MSGPSFMAIHQSVIKTHSITNVNLPAAPELKSGDDYSSLGFIICETMNASL